MDFGSSIVVDSSRKFSHCKGGKLSVESNGTGTKSGICESFATFTSS